MSWGAPDVYYQPEKFGLEMVGEFDLAEADYSFELFAVWRDKETGDFYYATDSGCSCPSPFMGYTSLSDLTAASKHDIIHKIADCMGEPGVDSTAAVNLIVRINSL